MSVITKLDFNDKVRDAEYPNILLPEVNQATPLIVKLLDPGTLPLVGELNGIKKVIARVSDSAYNIDKLLRTHSEVRFNKNKEESYDLSSITDYLEVFNWI